MEIVYSEFDRDDFVLRKTINEIDELLREYEGFCYINHPIFGLNSTIDSPSITILSRLFGALIIDVYDFNVNNISTIKEPSWYLINCDWEEKKILDDLDDKYSTIYGKIITNRILRKFSESKDKLKVRAYVYLANINRSSFTKKFPLIDIEKLLFEGELIDYLKNQLTSISYEIPVNIWNNIINILSGAHILNKPERSVKSEKTKAGIIRKIENQIQIFDKEQIKVAQQIPPGPQRIRGLAGTGKTIVLALKAVYMHLKHPEWNIVYTFNTQSLYDYIYSLIRRFYKYWRDGEPNWEKLSILHGWGGKSKQGLYSYVSMIMNKIPKTYSEARNNFEFKRNSELLGKCCEELINLNLPPLFDAILIDEAQDFDKKFFQFCYKILVEPKKLIWAYDELQSLENINIPTAKDIFGVNSDGIPIVNLEGVYEGGIEKDFVLYKSYRNPRLILMVAHIFGMGLLREEGAIQFLPNKGSWEDLGYEIIDGEFETNNLIKITRSVENTPNIIEEYVSKDDLLRIKSFNEKKEELKWIAEQIEIDIKDGNLRPEDILIIGFSNHFPNFNILKTHLKGKKINSFVIGSDVGKATFRLPNMVTMSTVFKAKGNEAISIYIFDFESSERRSNIIQSRNMAFSSITRTKGWVTITGTGVKMTKLVAEISNIIKQYPEISFFVPDSEKIKRQLDNVEYEKRRIRIKKIGYALIQSLKDIDKLNGISELPKSAKDKIAEIAKKLENESERKIE